MANTNFNFEADQVMDFWNKFEMELVPIIDCIAQFEPLIKKQLEDKKAKILPWTAVVFKEI